jgi:Tol biopolymer transport system component
MAFVHRALVSLSCVGLALAAAPASAGVTTRESEGAADLEANGESYNSAISATGRYVVFQSAAYNLDPADTLPGSTNVYLRDVKLDTTRLVSLNSDGVLGNGYDAFPVVSKNGRIVVWESDASNLVPGDGNAKFDIFARDMKTGITTRISVDSAGAEGDKDSLNPTVSDNGRYVAFQSDATNLVPLDTNQRTDTFVHDRKTGITTRISVDSAGNQGSANSGSPVLSTNGRYVVFYSESVLAPGDSGDVVDVYVHDRKTGITTWDSPDAAGGVGDGGSSDGTISSSGRYVSFLSYATDLVEGDGNGVADIFLRDRKKGVTTRVSVDMNGNEADAASLQPVLSANGKVVAFESYATDLTAIAGIGKLSTYARVLKAGTTALASVTVAGTQADEDCSKPGLSKNGRWLTFATLSAELIAVDGNSTYDVFLRDLKD